MAYLNSNIVELDFENCIKSLDNPEDTDSIEKLQNDPNNSYFAQYEEDNLWYPCKIVRHYKDGKVVVCFTEYNNMQICRESDLRSKSYKDWSDQENDAGDEEEEEEPEAENVDYNQSINLLDPKNFVDDDMDNESLGGEGPPTPKINDDNMDSPIILSQEKIVRKEISYTAPIDDNKIYPEIIDLDNDDSFQNIESNKKKNNYVPQKPIESPPESEEDEDEDKDDFDKWNQNRKEALKNDQKNYAQAFINSHSVSQSNKVRETNVIPAPEPEIPRQQKIVNNQNANFSLMPEMPKHLKDDHDLKCLLASWYAAGYYAGKYDAKHDKK